MQFDPDDRFTDHYHQSLQTPDEPLDNTPPLHSGATTQPLPLLSYIPTHTTTVPTPSAAPQRVVATAPADTLPSAPPPARRQRVVASSLFTTPPATRQRVVAATVPATLPPTR